MTEVANWVFSLGLCMIWVYRLLHVLFQAQQLKSVYLNPVLCEQLSQQPGLVQPTNACHTRL